MRTFDKQYLITHPLGDEKAEFTLSANIPDSAGVPLNPDGTKPQVTVQVTADTYMTALQILGELHEDSDDLAGTWAAQQITDKQYRKALKLIERGEPADFVQKAADKIHPQYLTFKTSVSFVTEDDGAETSHVVDLAISAPSVTIGLAGFRSITRPRSLQSVAISFCPEINDDEYGYSDEVMVIG